MHNTKEYAVASTQDALERLVDDYNQTGRANIPLLDHLINHRVMLNRWDELGGNGHHLEGHKAKLMESIDSLLLENYPVFFGPRTETADQCIPTIISLTQAYHTGSVDLDTFAAKSSIAMTNALRIYRTRLQFLSEYPEDKVHNEKEAIRTHLKQLTILCAQMNDFYHKTTGSRAMPFDPQLSMIGDIIGSYFNGIIFPNPDDPDA